MAVDVVVDLVGAERTHVLAVLFANLDVAGQVELELASGIGVAGVHAQRVQRRPAMRPEDERIGLDVQGLVIGSAGHRDDDAAKDDHDAFAVDDAGVRPFEAGSGAGGNAKLAYRVAGRQRRLSGK